MLALYPRKMCSYLPQAQRAYDMEMNAAAICSYSICLQLYFICSQPCPSDSHLNMVYEHII